MDRAGEVFGIERSRSTLSGGSSPACGTTFHQGQASAPFQQSAPANRSAAPAIALRATKPVDEDLDVSGLVWSSCDVLSEAHALALIRTRCGSLRPPRRDQLGVGCPCLPAHHRSQQLGSGGFFGAVGRAGSGRTILIDALGRIERSHWGNWGSRHAKRGAAGRSEFSADRCRRWSGLWAGRTSGSIEIARESPSMAPLSGLSTWPRKLAGIGDRLRRNDAGLQRRSCRRPESSCTATDAGENHHQACCAEW